MSSYIWGISIGSIVILAGITILIIWSWKNKATSRLIKKLGATAEESINSDIKIWAKHTKNKFIPATLFKYGENMVFEVDSVLITNRALIVIEIKSIKGGIEGSGQDMSWKKVLGQTKHDITNPIIQNDKHIKHIVKMTDFKIPTISLIVYSNRVSYINVKNIPSHAVVIKQSDLFDTLDEINKSLPISLSDEQVKNVYSKIKSFKATKREDIQLHKNITQKGHGG